MKPIHRVLAIETSCDDTSIAIINDSSHVLYHFVMDQKQAHQPFAGVVPEIAGRKHLEVLLPLIHKAFCETGFNWEQIDGIAVTQGPGLMGSLLVGTVTAQVLALIKQKPLIGINHLEGHILAPFLKDGHTALYSVTAPFEYKLLESTVDDAAGEAFDKLAQMLDLGFPGGVHVDRLAKEGDRYTYNFPRPLLKGKNFSFSGLKTAALRVIKGMTLSEKTSQAPSICASYQEAIVDVLLAKLMNAAKGYKNVVITEE